MKFLFAFMLVLSFEVFASNDTLSIKQPTVLEIKDGKEIFQAKPDFWEKYSSGLIAALTVFVSLGISVWQARKSIKANRAHSISEARIVWIQELRPKMAELISLASMIHYEIREVNKKIDLSKNELRTEINDLEREILLKRGQKIEELVYQGTNALNIVKLYLNLDEDNHQRFVFLSESYLNQAKKIIENPTERFDVSEDDVIKCGNKILKDVWRQAKK